MPLRNGTKIIGHRGAAGYAPENTLKSFQLAIELGCDRTEFDVHLSKDGVPMVIHDSTVDRTTDGRGEVRNLTLGELRQLRCAEGQAIPTLQDVIDLCKGKIDMQVELKAPGTAEAVYQAIKGAALSGTSAVVTSFHVDLLAQIKQLDPDIPVGLLFRNASFRLLPQRLWKLTGSIPVNYFGSRSVLLSGRMIRQAHERGLKAYAYDVNSVRIAQLLTRRGVDEICTDYPKLFLNA